MDGMIPASGVYGNREARAAEWLITKVYGDS
jgi:hypothetical protein